MKKNDKEFRKWFIGSLKKRGKTGWLMSYRRLSLQLQNDMGIELSRDTVGRRLREMVNAGMINAKLDRSDRRGHVATFRYSIA